MNMFSPIRCDKRAPVVLRREELRVQSIPILKDLESMGKAAATTAASGKKRAREAKRPADSSSESSSSSGGGEEPAVAAAAVASSSSEEESDSDDDEVENALFRPAAAKTAASNSDSNDDGEGEEQEVGDASSSSSDEEEAPVKSEATTKKAAAKKETAKKEAANPETAQLQEEIERKTEATVYVEGIPYSADEGDVVSHFSSCGIVKEVRMPRYQDSGKPRGYAHVVFEDAKAIAKALKLDGKYLFGRYLTVRLAQTPRMVEMAIQEQKASGKKIVKGCRTVFIKQLPYDVEETTIREALASCGTIQSVRLPLWNHTKKLKGFGYVEFASEEEALAATKRTGMKIGDRMVIINLDVAGGAPKASFRTRDGQFWNKGEEAKKSLAKKMTDKQQRQAKAKTASSHKKRKTE